MITSYDSTREVCRCNNWRIFVKVEVVEELLCPARDWSGSNLSIEAYSTETLEYRAGLCEEVREGSLKCESCGRAYPISDYVLSFEQLFPDALREEADYWGKWYT